jgi:hypothetical protein
VPGITHRRYPRAVTEEVRQTVLAGDDDGDCDEAWERLTDEPSVRGVNSSRWADDGTWQVSIWTQEFFRSDALGMELRERVVRALESVEGVTSVAEHDNESWDVYGTPSGEALTRAAANVVDDLADRLRQALGLA